MNPTDAQLKPWGYAPGNYFSTCYQCKGIIGDLDKRANCCRPCAVRMHAAPVESNPAVKDSLTPAPATTANEALELLEAKCKVSGWTWLGKDERDACITIRGSISTPKASPGSKGDPDEAERGRAALAWMRMQAKALNSEVTEDWGPLYLAKVIGAHIKVPAPSQAVARESPTSPAQGPDAIYSHPMATIKLYNLQGGTESVPTILAEASASVKTLLENGMIRFMAPTPGAAPTTEKGGA